MAAINRWQPCRKGNDSVGLKIVGDPVPHTAQYYLVISTSRLAVARKFEFPSTFLLAPVVSDYQ